MSNINYIVFDGSFKPGHISIGLVYLDNSFDIIKVKSILLECPNNYATNLKGSAQSEFIAAAFALKDTDKNSPAIVYGDLDIAINTINGDYNNEKGSDNIEPGFSMLRLLTEEFYYLRAYHRNDITSHSVPRHCFAIAHNASAIASGSIKRECTLPYTGNYSSLENVDSKTFRENRTDKQERLQRYGFI